MTMKSTIANCILSLFAALLLVGCSEDFMSALHDGDTKTITFNLQQPSWTETTRAFTGDDVSTIDINNLQLVCFDSEGGYAGLASVTASATTANQITATVPYNTNRIHFLYDAGFDATNVTTGTNEAAVLSPNTLTTTNKMACWAYIADLNKFVSDTNTDKTVKLQRNVAKVSVTSDEGSPFTATLYAVTNDMNKGCVVPFDFKNTSAPFSSSNYDATTGLPSFVTIPLDATRNTTTTALTDNPTAAYLFETQQNTSSTADSIAVIVKLTYTSDNTVRYHLMRLMDGSKELFDIQRNHNYKITMSSSIPSTLGYATADEAVAGVATNSYATIENVIDMDKVVTTPSIELMDASSNALTSLTVYPALDYSSTTFDVASTGSVKQKFYFWYKNATETVTSLTASDFTVSKTGITGATAEVESFDATKKYGVVTLTILNSSLSAAGNVGTVTVSKDTYSSSLAVNAATWSESIFSGTISYYSKESDGTTDCFTLNNFTINNNSSSITSGTNLRVASKYLIPKTSSSTFNNVYIDATPIDGVDYWYNVPEWNSDDLTGLFNQLEYKGTTTSDVYVMADGIKASKVTWNDLGEKPATPDYIYWYYSSTNSTWGLFTSASTETAYNQEYPQVKLSGGSTETSSSSLSINGNNYKNSYKVNSDAKIKIETKSVVTMTAYFTNKNVIKIDNTVYNNSSTPAVVNASDGLYCITISLSAGEHTIERDASNIYMYLIVFK